MLGSWTRINRAGMTCPDYPLCNGKLIPALTGGTQWEWLHRLTALLLCALVIAVVWLALREKRHSARASFCAILVIVFFAVQVSLGALTVHLSNSPFSVVWHWGTGMALVASLVALTVFSRMESHRNENESPSPALIGVLCATAAVSFVTMCAGVYVSTSGAGLACVSLPGCAGNAIVFGSGQWVQMLHRVLATFTLICTVSAFAGSFVWRANAAVRAATSAGLALVFVQIVLGLLNVALRLPIDLREAHAANAALVFLAFVSAIAFAIAPARRLSAVRAS